MGTTQSAHLSKSTREYVVKTVLDVSCGGQVFGLDDAIQTKEFSNAIAVMDRIGGWEEGGEQENWVGARFAASIWIHTKAAVCNGESHSVLEEVNWVCDDARDDHVWVSEQTIALHEGTSLGGSAT